MKKSILLLFAALLPLVASARKIEIDGIWYNLDESAKQAEVTYKGDDPNQGGWYSGSITLPATVTYDGVAYSVTSIGHSAFFGCTSLTAINIPEGVTSIGDKAFLSCRSLTAIAIPESVTSIGGDAFSGCWSLTAVHISSIEAWCKIWFNGSLSNPLSFAQNLYLNGELVTELVIPEGVTSIGDDAFNGCISLASITIPESVTSIGGLAFYGCYNLTAITIPEGVTSIGEVAFGYCSNLTAITIPEGVTSIGEIVFGYCRNLTAIIVAEGNKVYDSRGGCNAIIETASNTLIAGCSTTIIPESVTSIGSYAFEGCIGLTTITIPEGVTSIGDDAFGGCYNLTAITIPESVTSIGTWAFSGCSNLTDIYCYSEEAPPVENAFGDLDLSRIILHVPKRALKRYKNTEPWSRFGAIEVIK